MQNEPTISEIRQEISDEELNSMTNAIKIRYGFDFTNYEKKSLKRGFARIISKYNLGSLLGLWSKILKDRSFMLGCIDDLTVNLTELFRNPEIWLKLKDDVLQQYQTKWELNIWHAGCSTGEEIYTMAFVLNDAGMLRKAKILGTDLSQSVLYKAQEAKYPLVIFNKYIASFRKYLNQVDVGNYFTLDEENATVKPEFRRQVTFQRHNLVQDGPPKKFDIIFCRNVMIYFDESLKMKALKLFYDSLSDDGYFIIGYYDMLPEQYKNYFTIYDSTTRIYKKVRKT